MSISNDSQATINPEDTIKILVATDIHLGYKRSKKDIVDDSFITFEEILQYGKEYDVDFVLLGGDLFHDAKPAQKDMLKCIDLLRKYCLGPKEIKIDFLSHPEEVFKHCTHKVVNYEDPNLNVSMPVFTIHGNHDDPNLQAVGSMDLLASSGLINYFGKWCNLNKLVVSPLMIQKGESLIALYGLGYVNDQRLSRLIRDYKLEMLCPGNDIECFNICVLHQNRAKHAEYQHIPDNKLPSFLDLIIWGHEHECRIRPEYIPTPGYFICQPGSSIATSLAEGEAQPKHVGLLTINKSKFKLKKLRLKTVRPFVFENLHLSTADIKQECTEELSDAVYIYVDSLIENTLIPRAAEQLTQHPKQPITPLLRLRIFYTSEDEKFDVMRIAQKYCDEILNPMDAIVWRKDTIEMSKNSNTSDKTESIADIYNCETEAEVINSLEDELERYLSTKKEMISVFSTYGLNEALRRFVQRSDTDAFRDIISHQMQKNVEYLKSCKAETADEVLEAIYAFRDKRLEKYKEDKAEVELLLNNPEERSKNQLLAKKKKTTLDLVGDCDSDEANPQEKGIKRGTTRGRPRGTTKGRPRGTRARGRGGNLPALDVTTMKASSSGLTESDSTKGASKPTKNQTLLKFSSSRSSIMLSDSDDPFS